MHSRVYALWTQSEDLSVFLAFTRNGLRLEGPTPVLLRCAKPKGARDRTSAYLIAHFRRLRVTVRGCRARVRVLNLTFNILMLLNVN